MDFVTLLSNAFCSGAGALVGGLAAYYWACRRDNQRKTSDYLSLLLMIYSDLDAIYSIFAKIPQEYIKDIDGQKVVAFDIPFPSLNLSPQQLQILLEVSPDKQMSLGLIAMQHFLTNHAQRIASDGVNVLTLDLVKQMEKQLKFMLASARNQYEQETNGEFPFYEVTLKETSQKKQQNLSQN